MANRFWVGGSGNWDASTTTHWSATTGGAGGASVPTSADSVFVDANSGSSPTITVTATANCLDLTFTGAITPILTGVAQNIMVYGNITFISTMSVAGSNTFIMSSTTTGKTITTSGLILNVSGFQFDGVGGGWTLQDNLNLMGGGGTGTFRPLNGTVDTNGKTLTCAGLSHSSGTVTLTLGSSIINMNSNWNQTGGTGLTLNAGTSTINFTGATSGLTGTGHTFYNVNFTGATPSITTSNTFNILSVAANCTLSLTAGTTQTVTNFVSNGIAGNLAILKSATGASAATISTPSTINVSYLSVQDITRTGAGTMTVSRGTNVSGNTGITFTIARYWVGGSGNTSNTAHWSTTSGGAGGASVPTSANDIFLNSASFSTSGQVVTVDVDGLSFDFTGATNSPSVVFTTALAILLSSSTFNAITLAAGKTLKLTSGTTQTLTSLVCNGTIANPNTLQAATTASPATIALPAGRYFIRHTSIKDITVTGATTTTNIAGTNVSGNTGITFVTKFEMGRIKNDGGLYWYSSVTGSTAKVSG